MVKECCGVSRRPAGRRWTLARFVLGGCVFLGGSWAAWGAPAVSKMLEYKPRHDVAYSTPALADQANCKVELVKGKAGSGWALKDAQGKLVRQFYSSDGRNVDTYSYYRDGVEVYREIVTPGSRSADQFRWLNAGGAKWGVDEDRNGTIDSWKAISPEEVGQEVLKALATRDLARLQALMVTDADLLALGLPADAADAVRAKRAGVKAKFEATIAKLTKLSEKAEWTHLETGLPQCLPAEQTGAKADVYRHTRATVLFQVGEANEWFQVGTMYLVGSAWKVVDAPSPGAGYSEEPDGKSGAPAGGIGIEDPKTLKLVEVLTEHDKKAVPAGAGAVAHHVARADLLEKIVYSADPKQRDPWIRQLADSLSSAAQAGTSAEAPAVVRLDSLEKQLVKAMPGSNLTAYVAFRRMQADYSVKLGKGEKDFNKVQQDWLEKLTGFVKAYPKGEDTPDAMLQAGMVCEFLGKDGRGQELVLAARDRLQGQAAGRQGRGGHPPPVPRGQPDAGRRAAARGRRDALRHRADEGQHRRRLLLGELERPGRERLHQAQGGRRRQPQGREGPQRQPRQQARGGQGVPGQQLPGRDAPVPAGRPRQPARHAVRHHRPAEPVHRGQGRQVRQQERAGRHGRRRGEEAAQEVIR